jgi:hypothetical protein
METGKGPRPETGRFGKLYRAAYKGAFEAKAMRYNRGRRGALEGSHQDRRVHRYHLTQQRPRTLFIRTTVTNLENLDETPFTSFAFEPIGPSPTAGGYKSFRFAVASSRFEKKSSISRARSRAMRREVSK